MTSESSRSKPEETGTAAESTSEREQAPAPAPEPAPENAAALNGDDVAPALAMMSINGRADSAVGSGEDDDDSSVAEDAAPKPSLRHDNRVPPRGAAVDAGPQNEIARDLGVENVVDLNDSVDTTYHAKQAPAVVQETTRADVHEILHEVIDREIHHHHVYRRILPVHEVEVLPARHFIEDTDGVRREVPRHMVPGRDPDITDRMLAQAFKTAPPLANRGEGESSKRSFRPLEFSARKFPGTEGDYREWVDDAGTKHTEQWWVHPPMLEKAAAFHPDRYEVHFED